MKLPKKIKIGGFTYKIVVLDNLVRVTGSEEADGLITPNRSIIHIVKKESEQFMGQAFLHEVMHGIDMAYNGDVLDEPTIERISQGLYQVLKDNKLDF